MFQSVSRPDSGDCRVRDGRCTQHHLSHAFFLTADSLSSCSQLFVSVRAHLLVSRTDSTTHMRWLKLNSSSLCSVVSQASSVKRTHLHPCSIHLPCCTRSATLACTCPRHLPAHHLLRHFRDQLRRHYSRKAQLRREVCGLALWPTRTSLTLCPQPILQKQFPLGQFRCCGPRKEHNWFEFAVWSKMAIGSNSLRDDRDLQGKDEPPIFTCEVPLTLGEKRVRRGENGHSFSVSELRRCDRDLQDVFLLRSVSCAEDALHYAVAAARSQENDSATGATMFSTNCC